MSTILYLSSASINNEQYYIVEPTNDKQSEFHYNWSDMEAWCTEMFGSTPADGVWTSGAVWYMNNSKFWFRNELDQTLFVLKWQ